MSTSTRSLKMGEEYLPEELMMRIFERLPIKPLIRFTCVSKRWRFIILYDPQFAKSHFQISSQHRTLTRRLIFNTQEESESDSDSDFESDSESEPEPEPELEYEFESHDLGDLDHFGSSIRKLPCPFSRPDYETIMCSCNGLVFIVTSTSIYLWNPTTGFYRTLPYLSSQFESICDVGLGYVSSSDDYKLIASVLPEEDEEVGSQDIEYYTFSLRAKVWKRLQVPPKFYMTGESTLSNEAIHRFLVGRNEILTVFDLAREEFSTMQLPISIHQNFRSNGGLKILGSSLGGHLCLLNYYHNGGFADLWVLRDYGMTDSWTKQFSFKSSMTPFKVVLIEESTVLVVVEEGISYLKLIRSGHEEEQELVEIPMGRKNNFGVINYQETLLWLP